MKLHIIFTASSLLILLPGCDSPSSAAKINPVVEHAGPGAVASEIEPVEGDSGQTEIGNCCVDQVECEEPGEMPLGCDSEVIISCVQSYSYPQYAYCDEENWDEFCVNVARFHCGLECGECEYDCANWYEGCVSGDSGSPV